MPKPKSKSKLSFTKSFGIVLSLTLMIGQSAQVFASPSSKGDATRQGDTTGGDAVMSDATDDGHVDAAQPAASAPLPKKTRAELIAEDEAAKAAAELASAAALKSALEHLELGQNYERHFNFNMAELEFESAIMYAPEMKTAHRDYCVASLLTGHPARALAEFMMVVGLGDPIPLNDAERTELTARGAKLHYKQGVELVKKKNWDDAVAEFNAALLYAPNNAAIVRSLAFSLASSGKFELAEEQYNHSFSMDDSDPYSHADFAYVLSEHGQDKKAMDQLSDAIKLDPKVAALHIDMAWMAESKGELQTAESEFREAIQLSPKHAILWSHLGRVEERLGKANDAKSAYTEALAIDPSQDEARKRLDELKNAKAPEGEQPVETKQAKKAS